MPTLETHYTFDSCLRTEDAAFSPISLIKTPQFTANLLFNGIQPTDPKGMGAARLKLTNVTFKHIPYDVKAR